MERVERSQKAEHFPARPRTSADLQQGRVVPVNLTIGMFRKTWVR